MTTAGNTGTGRQDNRTGIETLDNIADMMEVEKDDWRKFWICESGHGTVLFQKLLQFWISKFFELSECEKENGEKLKKCMSEFDLLFHVTQCFAKKRPSVVDFVCDSIPGCDKNTKKQIKRMLGDRNIRCLIILEDLDKLPFAADLEDEDLVNTMILGNFPRLRKDPPSLFIWNFP